MPFDSKDFVETKPDVFSLEGLIAWLETQDPATTYCWVDGGHCLLAQYAKAVGSTYLKVTVGLNGGRHGEPDGIAILRPWTYGAALERARKLLAAQ